jgi:hypothetical protein
MHEIRDPFLKTYVRRLVGELLRIESPGYLCLFWTTLGSMEARTHEFKRIGFTNRETEAIHTQWSLGDPELTPHFISELSEQTSERINIIVYASLRNLYLNTGDEAAIRFLFQRLKTEGKRKAQTALAIITFQILNERYSEEAFEFAMSVLSRGTKGIDLVSTCFRTLEKLSDTRAVPLLLECLHNEKDASRSQGSLRALKTCGDSTLFEHVLPFVFKNTWSYSDVSVDCICTWMGAEATPFLCYLLRLGRFLRWTAMEKLAMWGDDRAFVPVLNMVTKLLKKEVRSREITHPVTMHGLKYLAAYRTVPEVAALNGTVKEHWGMVRECWKKWLKKEVRLFAGMPPI